MRWTGPQPGSAAEEPALVGLGACTALDVRTRDSAPRTADPSIRIELSILSEHLFVYGTLRSGLGASHFLSGRTDRVGEGWIPGRLYDSGSYPAAVSSAETGERVHGELHRLRPESASTLLAELDRYEGFLPDAPERSLFRRIRTEIILQDGGRYSGWVYVFNHPVGHLARIVTGDYADYLRGPGRR